MQYKKILDILKKDLENYRIVCDSRNKEEMKIRIEILEYIINLIEEEK